MKIDVDALRARVLARLAAEAQRRARLRAANIVEITPRRTGRRAAVVAKILPWKPPT